MEATDGVVQHAIHKRTMYIAIAVYTKGIQRNTIFLSIPFSLRCFFIHSIGNNFVVWSNKLGYPGILIA